jgi:hypothetical protein
MTEGKEKMKCVWRLYELMSKAEDAGNVDEYRCFVEAVVSMAVSTLNVINSQTLTEIRKEEDQIKKRVNENEWDKKVNELEGIHEYMIAKRNFNVHEGHEKMSKGKQKVGAYAAFSPPREYSSMEFFLKNGKPDVVVKDKSGKIIKNSYYKKMVYNFFFDDREDTRATILVHQFLIDVELLESSSSSFCVQ